MPPLARKGPALAASQPDAYAGPGNAEQQPIDEVRSFERIANDADRIPRARLEGAEQQHDDCRCPDEPGIKRSRQRTQRRVAAYRVSERCESDREKNCIDTPGRQPWGPQL